MAILIDNGLIVTGDTAGSRFEPGGVLIEDDRIAWVGPLEEAPEAARGARVEVIDARRSIGPCQTKSA